MEQGEDHLRGFSALILWGSGNFFNNMVQGFEQMMFQKIAVDLEPGDAGG